MGSSETRPPLPGGFGQWVAAMGYVIGAVALLKAAKGVEWRPARRRREDVSKRSGEKAHHAAPPAGPTSLPAAARPSSSKPAAEKEPDELAKMSLDPKDVTEDVSDLTADERKVLDDWVVKFEAKYPVVGRVEF